MTSFICGSSLPCHFLEAFAEVDGWMELSLSAFNFVAQPLNATASAPAAKMPIPTSCLLILSTEKNEQTPRQASAQAEWNDNQKRMCGPNVNLRLWLALRALK